MQTVDERAASGLVTCHPLPHSFAMPIRENAYGMGTAIIYSHDGLSVCNNKAHADLSAMSASICRGPKAL